MARRKRGPFVAEHKAEAVRMVRRVDSIPHVVKDLDLTGNCLGGCSPSADGRAVTRDSIEVLQNQERLHTLLGYRTSARVDHGVA